MFYYDPIQFDGSIQVDGSFQFDDSLPFSALIESSSPPPQRCLTRPALLEWSPTPPTTTRSKSKLMAARLRLSPSGMCKLSSDLPREALRSRLRLLRAAVAAAALQTWSLGRLRRHLTDPARESSQLRRGKGSSNNRASTTRLNSWGTGARPNALLRTPLSGSSRSPNESAPSADSTEGWMRISALAEAQLCSEGSF